MLHKSFFNTLPNPLAILDLDGKILEANPAWTAMLGWSVDELVPHSITAVVHPDDIAKVNFELKKVQRIKEPSSNFLARYICKNGGVKYLLWQCAIEDDRVSLCLQDATDHFNILKSLKLTNQEANIGYWELDLITFKTRWSEQAYKINDLPLGTDISLESYHQIIHPDFREFVSETVKQSCATGQSFDIKAKIKTPEQDKWVRSIGLVEFNVHNQAVRLYGTIQDITDLKKQQDQLNQIHKSLNASCLVSITDASGVITEVNDSFYQISGFGPKEVVGKNRGEFSSEFHDEAFFEQIKEATKGGKIWRGEICNRSKNGKVYWLDATICPHLNENGEIVSFVEISSDITLNKRLSKELAETKKFIETILNSLPDAIYVKNLDHEILYGNRAFSDLIGLKPHEFLNLDLRSIYDEEKNKGLFGMDKKCLEENKTVEYSGRISTKPGASPIDILLKKTPLITADGDKQVIATLRDVTQIKEQERKIEDQKNWLSLVLKNSDIGIWDWNLSTNEVRQDENWYAQLGLKSSDKINSFENWFARVHPEDQIMCKSAFKNYLKGVTDHYEICYRIKHSDGSYRYHLTRGQVIEKTETGWVNRVVGTTFDVTHQKELEQSLESQKLSAIQSSKLASLGEMAGGVAHEINNPLMIIQGKLMQLGNMNLQNINEIKFKEIIQKIDHTTTRIANIVKGLRNYCRDGSHDPFAPVQFNQLMEETLELCKEKLRSNGVSLRWSPSKDYTLNCRATQLTQILVNLINNAKDAVSELPEKWVSVEVNESNVNWLEIRITDSGGGIPLHIQEKMMQPFFTTKDFGKGTGLGLSISKGIIESHKGRLYINNNSPNTQFVIFIPKNPDTVEEIFSGDEAILTHLGIKQKINSFALNPDGSMAPDYFKGGLNTPIGKWLVQFEEGFKNSVNYQKIKDCHKKFHEEVFSVLTKIHEKNFGHIQELVGPHSAYELLSQELILSIKSFNRYLEVKYEQAG